VTEQLILFVNIIAWAMFVLATLRVLAVFHADLTEFRANPHFSVTPRRAEAFWKSLVLAFVAAAWLFAGRFA
jgi:hypothetical protein